MHRQPRVNEPKLESLLDERDHLRIKINLAEDDTEGNRAEILDMRRRLDILDRDIAKRWNAPAATTPLG